MSNLSYCRFQNALVEMWEAYDNMDNPVDGEEAKARQKIIKLCTLISAEYGEEAS